MANRGTANLAATSRTHPLTESPPCRISRPDYDHTGTVRVHRVVRNGTPHSARAAQKTVLEYRMGSGWNYLFPNRSRHHQRHHQKSWEFFASVWHCPTSKRATIVL